MNYFFYAVKMTFRHKKTTTHNCETKTIIAQSKRDK